MPKPIRHALERVLAVILVLLLPATGRRRRRGRPAHAAPRTLSGLRLFVHSAAVPALSEALVARSRTTKRTEHTAPLCTGPLVRPYLVAHERQQRHIGTPAVSLGAAA
ncbi:hypothetical protein GCM10009601_53350 [Streptomyces thermospinosisporus]|uniref:Secreted protein n=1 Tax=Streptomyces thermospinosisporus TaxID=161482 RepID=A0ABP4JW02_9ACTN